MESLSEEQIHDAKQDYIREEITNSGYNAVKFFQYLQSIRCNPK